MPTLDALDAAMLTADRSFLALPRIGGGQVTVTGGQPVRQVGSDAAVYQVRQANGRTLAVRVPFTDTLNPTIADAWQQIGTDRSLASLRDGDHPLVLADSRFLPDALVVPGQDSRLKRYPVMVMGWIGAPTLLTVVIRAASASDGAYIGQLARAWPAMVERMVSAGFAHGDLTGDNVLVRPGIDLALVDYDTATWPERSSGPLTRSMSAYTHPRANASTGSAERDRFASLLIHTSLRVLAEQPGLRANHGEDGRRPNGALLFSAWDLLNPERSELFGRLPQTIRDRTTLGMIEELRAACGAAPGAAPARPEPARAPRIDARSGLEGAIDRPSLSRPAVPAVGAATERTTPHLSTSFQGAPSGPVTTHERERRTARRATPPPSTVPTAIVASADGEQLASLLRRGERAGALAHWRSHGLGRVPALVDRFGEQMHQLEREEAVGHAQRAAQTNDTRRFLMLWQRYDLANLPAAETLRPIAEVARRRADAAERVRSAIATRDLGTVARYWSSLRGDTLVADLAIPAGEALQRFFGDRIGAALVHGDDCGLIEAVQQAQSQRIVIPPETRQAVRAARTRMTTRTQLEDALRQHDQVALADLLISGRLAALGDVPASVHRRALQALALPHLMRAIDLDRDDAIIGAYDPAVFDPREGEPDILSTRERARIGLAGRRIAWLEAVRTALRERDTRALGKAFAAVPENAMSRLSAVERRRIERLASREEAASDLASAIASGDDIAIVSALTQVASIGGSLPDELDWAAVRGVVDRVTLAEAIREAMTADPPDADRLARLLPVARAAAAADPDRNDIDFAELEREVLRAAHINRLRQAIVTDDDDEIATAATPDPFNAIDRLPPGQKERVERALAARARATGQAPKNRFIPTIYGSGTGNTQSPA
ncbi:MAG TPA: hypothetical protein VGT61_02750 [Thermomicrobiales bacterium]|jgi:hypothetical protein|nr:hypothetical protein [Thermomicrobiales bacterium]